MRRSSGSDSVDLAQCAATFVSLSMGGSRSQKEDEPEVPRYGSILGREGTGCSNVEFTING